MNYKESLKHPLWQKKRLEILQRDDFKCLVCHRKDKTLEIHHLFYLDFTAAYEYPDDWLITLCEDCHKKEQRRDELETHLAKTLKTNGFLAGDLLSFSSLIDTDENFTKQLLKTLREFQNA